MQISFKKQKRRHQYGAWIVPTSTRSGTSRRRRSETLLPLFVSEAKTPLAPTLRLINHANKNNYRTHKLPRWC